MKTKIAPLLIVISVFFPGIFGTWNGEKTTLDGSASYDPDGKIVTWHWQQISGPLSNIVNPDSAITEINTIKLTGIYEYELAVTDDSGAVGKDTMQLTAYKGALGITLDSVRQRERSIYQVELKNNYSSGKLMVFIKSPKIQAIDISLYDISSRLLFKKTFSLQKGDNVFEQPGRLQSGIYILNLSNYFVNETQKVWVAN